MDQEEKVFARYQLFLSMATLVLTPIFAGVVVQWQITRGHEVWVNQQRFSRSESYLDRKLELVEDLNARILKLEVAAKRIKQDQALIKAEMILMASANKPFDVQASLDELMQLIVDYHYELAVLASRVQTATLFFGDEVDAALVELRDAFANNFKSIPNGFDGIHNQILSAYKSGDLDLANKNLDNLDIETIPDLTKAREALIRKMISSISRGHELYVFDDVEN